MRLLGGSWFPVRLRNLGSWVGSSCRMFDLATLLPGSADYSQLQDYEPRSMSACMRRRRAAREIPGAPAVFTDPGGPQAGHHAFLAAEDKISTSYGVHRLFPAGACRVLYAQNYGSNRRPQALPPSPSRLRELSSDQRGCRFPARSRKPCCVRLELRLFHGQILELYLNEIISALRLRRCRAHGLFRHS